MNNRTGVKFLVLVFLMLFGFLLGFNRQTLAILLKNPNQLFNASSQDTITGKNLIKMLKNKNSDSSTGGFMFINVHTPYEGEIEKTDSFLPYDTIVENSALLPKDKNAPIILYCKTGRMSTEALVAVKKLGYTNVRHLMGGMEAWLKEKHTVLDLRSLEETITPTGGVTLPISFGTILPKLVSLGVIDLEAFKKSVSPTEEQLTWLTDGTDQKITITKQNSQFIVDTLWALGLAQKSLVYDEGPMGQEYKKNVGNFSSTGGWTLAKGNAVQYLNTYDLIPLTDAQQKQVSEIAKNVYRPCCGNSTWFPDCNHGMAALAAIELMVSANISENDIYRYVLALNGYWFSESYLTIATLFARQGTSWDAVSAKDILGAPYSSSKGANEVAKKVGPLPYRPTPSGGGCGT